MRKLFLPVLIITLISVNGFCQNGKTIELKFNVPAGSGYDYNMDMDMTMKGNANGQQINVSNTMAMGYHFSVTGDSAEWKKISTTMSHIAMKMDAGGVNIDYDSNTPDDTGSVVNNTIAKVFNAMKGSTFNFTINEKGQIGYVYGFDEMKNKMEASVPAGENASGLDNAFSEENFKQNMQQAFGSYPQKPVKVGDSWTSTMSTNNSGMQMKLDNTYTLKSVSGNTASVDVNSKISSDSGIPLKGTMTGIMQYDIPTGIPVNGNLDMLMNMSIDTGGQSTSLNMDIKMKMTGKKF